MKKGTRVKIKSGEYRGQVGTVRGTIKKVRRWVELDGRGGSQHGFALTELERIPKARGPKLPPDPEGKNEERADWAGAAISTFMSETRTDEGDALSDLLADLGHWADRNGARLSSIDGGPCSLLSELRRAAFHYDEETGGKGQQFEFLRAGGLLR